MQFAFFFFNGLFFFRKKNPSNCKEKGKKAKRQKFSKQFCFSHSDSDITKTENKDGKGTVSYATPPTTDSIVDMDDNDESETNCSFFFIEMLQKDE